MSGLDVEALLDSAAQEKSGPEASRKNSNDSNHDHSTTNGRKDGRHRDSSRGRYRRDDRYMNGDEDPRSPHSDKDNNAHEHRNRKSSRERGDDRGHARRGDRHREIDDRDRGDYYRGGGRYKAHSRSRSPNRRHYRPPGRDRRDEERVDRGDRTRDNDRRGPRGRDDRPRHSGSPRRAHAEPEAIEDDRDRRTVFVMQLAGRLRTKELEAFFEKAGSVKEAQIVKDRVSGKSKGVGYVEFVEEESVEKAIQLTGQKLLGVPIIAQLTEAEKNRQARKPEGATGNTNSVPFHRLYVGNIHFSITEDDLKTVFSPFGELEFVSLQKEDQGRSRGYGFVQYRNPSEARDALERMNGFDLANRPIRVGLGNDKFTPESTAILSQRFQGNDPRNFQGSAFSGHGGRGTQAGGSGGNFDRAGGRDTEKSSGGASALDDTDVSGVNFSNYSRDALMRKLARTDEPAKDTNGEKNAGAKAKAQPKPLPVQVNNTSRCIILRNMFNPEKEEGEDWVKELEEDVREECQSSYGNVTHISVDPNSTGDVYLKFEKIEGADNAIKSLNGRFYDGRTITAEPTNEAVYRSLFHRAL